MVSGVVALTAMVGYAFLSGLVQIETSNMENGNKGTPQMQKSNQSNFSNFERRFDDYSRGKSQGSGHDNQKDKNHNE